MDKEEGIIMARSLKTFLRNINYLTKVSLYDHEMEKDFYLTDKIIEDCVYEFDEDKKLFRHLSILDEYQSVELILKNPKSFCRFGDGEIKLMLGNDQPFQKYDPILARKLKDILEKKRQDLYVGINRGYFHSPVTIPYENRQYYRLHAYEFRHFFLEHCDSGNIYLDAGFTGRYFGREDNGLTKAYVGSICDLFTDRDIVLVSGKGVYEKLRYDVFHKARSKSVIHGPNKHAYAEYDNILRKICNTVSKDQLVVLILGMAAKAMVRDLTDCGYMAWDVGHMAKYYDAYMSKLPYTKKNIADFFAPD
ncbi:MAG: DUF1792 domain-containing protein [Lachnospiraceae bacterium]|nr:DUF1792 domain-containing protein [Lachnospiraceae bacterium]